MADQQMSGSADRVFIARLVAADGTGYELSGEQTLGRSEHDDITITQSNISRGHARIRLAGDQVSVEDLGSTNGTRVNRQRIDGVVVLRDGDLVSFDTVDFRVEIPGVANDSDTQVENPDDAVTVIGSQPEPAPDPAPPSPAATPSKPAAPVVPPPGNWEENDDGTGTIFIPAGQKQRESSPAVSVEHSSELPHLIMFNESGLPEVLELETSDGDEQDVWEIGRDEHCTIVVADDSVSATHAQLIHQDDRWRLKNLVSTNGIYVNGEKRLTAFLADGDEIRLGMTKLVFKSGSDAAKEGAGDFNLGSRGAGSGLATRLSLGVGIAVIAAVLWWIIT